MNRGSFVLFTQIHTNLVPSRHRSFYVCVCFCWFACFFFRIVYSRMYTLVSIARRERQIFNTVIILRISVCECVVYMFCVSFTTFFVFINIYLVYFLLPFITLYCILLLCLFVSLFAVSFCWFLFLSFLLCLTHIRVFQ